MCGGVLTASAAAAVIAVTAVSVLTPLVQLKQNKVNSQHFTHFFPVSLFRFLSLGNIIFFMLYGLEFCSRLILFVCVCIVFVFSHRVIKISPQQLHHVSV